MKIIFTDELFDFILVQLKCVAKIYDIYEESAERTVEDDSTNGNVMTASGTSGASAQNINSYQSYDHPQGGELSSDGLYLTHQTSGKCNFLSPLMTFPPTY